MQPFLFNPYFLAIVAALLPIALLLSYIYRQDREKPEPAKWLWKGVWYGVLSALIIVFGLGSLPGTESVMEMMSDSVLGAVLNAFLLAAVPEEAAKIFMLWLLLRKNPYFDEHLDGIVYAVCIGLGFAGFENILYITGNMDNLVQVAVIRGLFSVPAHFFYAVAMGYFISLAHFNRCTKQERLKNYASALFLPILLHGIFDALLMTMSVNEYLAAVCFLLFLYFTNKMRKKGVERIKIMQNK